jgi:hypothetical protein
MTEERIVRSADVLAGRLKEEPEVGAVVDPPKLDALAVEAKGVADRKNDMQGFVRALESDRIVYRMTVMFLGWAIILVVAGIASIKLLGIYLAKSPSDYTVPEALVAIASTAIGALAGLLSPIGAQSR